MALTQIPSTGIKDAAVTSTQLASTITLSGNITGGNLIGPYSNTTSNINIPTAGGNINFSAAGNANILIVTGTGANISGTANVSGNANVGNIGGGSGIFTANITAGNVYANSGTVGASSLSGTLTTAAQPNVTSVGTLSSLTVTGNITGGNLLGPHANGNSNVNIPSANGNVNISAVGNANILVVNGTGANVTGSLTASGNVSIGTTATTLAGSGYRTIVSYGGAGVLGLDNTNNVNKSWGILIGDTGAGGAGNLLIVQNVNGSGAGISGGPCVPIIGFAPPTTPNNASRLYIDGSGNVGISNVAPTHTLSVTGTMNVSSNTQITSLGVGTAASGTTGEIRATNNITAFYSSDIKFKENVRDIPDATGKVKHIGGKLFDWKDEYIESKGGEDGYFTQKSDFGVIAQDVITVFPQAVRKRSDGTLAVDYEKLSALAFAAIKELIDRIDKLEKKIIIN